MTKRFHIYIFFNLLHIIISMNHGLAQPLFSPHLIGTYTPKLVVRGPHPGTSEV